MNNEPQIEIMIYRDTKLDWEYALKRFSRRFSRALWAYTRKVLIAINWGIEELVREANKK